MTGRQKIIGKIIARRRGKKPNFDDFSITTRQPIASCSKWLSAALVMTFVDEGKLNLTDTVGKFLPVLSQMVRCNYYQSVPFPYNWYKSSLFKRKSRRNENIGSMDEAIEKIATLPMEGEPGKVFHYSNAGCRLPGQ